MTAVPRIMYEVPSQRRHYRVSVPITVTFQDLPYQTKDWGIGGFRIPNVEFDTEDHESYECFIHIEFGDFNISFQTFACVIWRNEDSNEIAF